MKKLITMVIMVLAVTVAMAQAPEKLTYQAVVRNANNSLVANAQVGIRVNILQGSATGNAVYSESHVATTNANGLVTVSIGGGSVLHGSFAGIDWADGPYFLKTDIDPNGGNDYSITTTQQLLSVPYALYAKEAGNGFSGDYNDLTNKPEIPTVPTNVSAFTNDAGYLTNYTEIDPTVPAWAKEANKPTYNYSEIVNTPTIPTVPTNVSAFTNDAGYITGYTETDPQFNAWDKDYNDLINKPTIPTVPTNVSTFTNDANYVTTSQLNAANYITAAQVPAQVNADWNATSGAAQILNKPTLFSGNYSDLTNKPTLFDGNYNSLTNKPNLSAVAISGNYNDLINKPAIPTAVGELTNNVGYITAAQVPAQVNADWNATTGAAQILNKPTLFSGSYDDLTNKPVLFDGDYNSLTNKPVLFDGDYNSLTNKPTIPTIPSNVSVFANDAGYVTALDVQQAAGIPTQVSAFQNDAGYITASQVPTQVNADWNATSGKAMILNKPTIPPVPSNVSVFNNDAHYITEAQLDALLAAMNNTIDSLRNRIEELEEGGTPVTPDPGPSDTTVTPSVPGSVDGLACPGMATVTDYDGNVYNTVAIGQQCWMKENLRTSHYANGTAITLSTTASTTDPFRYNPGGSADNVNTCGFVYNWLAVMNGSLSSNANPSSVQGICPTGWHVPSNMEWSQMTGYVNSQNDFKCSGTALYIAKALASTTLWSSNSINCAIGDYAPNNNATGFSALPAGNISGTVGTNANFWSCTQSDNSTAYAIQLDATSPVVTVNPDAAKTNGFSVRCVRDIAIEGDVTQMVTTAAVSSITSTTAVCGGTVNSGNGSVVTARGVCWSVTQNPTVAGDHTTDGSGTGTFTSAMTGLQPGTTYYVRAYATNSAGTAYGYTQTFTTQNDASTCGTATITDYDGNIYNTVQIGDQCWMKENLRTTHYADGTYIPVGASDQTTIGYRWAPNYNDTTVVNPYGYLYNWYAVMCGTPSSNTNPSGVRGVCPIGWHVPSDAEWTQLTDYVSSQPQYRCGENQDISKALASQIGWGNGGSSGCSPSSNPNANNATGFSALPAGFYNYVTESIISFGRCAEFWSATGLTSNSNDYWWFYAKAFFAGGVGNGGNGKYVHYSVRCLRD